MKTLYMRTIYKQDTKGNVRTWYMEVEGNKYRTVSGLQGGKQTFSKWTTVKGKNIGRSNETTPEEQAVLEAEAKYTKKLEVDYHEELDTVEVEKIFKPMLAAKYEDVEIDYSQQKVFIQPKLDGIRCIATKDGLFSRGGKPIVSCPHIEEQLKPFFEHSPDVIFDGELYNHKMKDDFNAIVSAVKKTKPKKADLKLSAELVEYHVYDLPSSADKLFSVRSETLRLIADNPRFPSVLFVPTIEVSDKQQVDDVYGGYIEQGYEGGIIRVDGLYEQKRSKTLLKRKDFEDAEFTIIRIEEGKGNWSGAAKRVFFRNDDGREVGAGLKGTYEFAKKVLEEADEYIGKQVTVQFFTRTPDGVPRFPIAKVLHKEERL